MKIAKIGKQKNNTKKSQLKEEADIAQCNALDKEYKKSSRRITANKWKETKFMWMCIIAS